MGKDRLLEFFPGRRVGFFPGIPSSNHHFIAHGADCLSASGVTRPLSHYALHWYDESMERMVLHPQQLRLEQDRTLAIPPERYGLPALFMFRLIDLIYGRARTWQKFKVNEIMARMPYQAWEHVAYSAITHTHEQEQYARRIFERVKESREEQDNEQWHLLIIQEWIKRKGLPESKIKHRITPRLLAFAFYHLTLILYAIRPDWSYQFNVDLEDHAEREYMTFVLENPELEREPFISMFKKDFGSLPTMADVVRQIAVDERTHKEESRNKIDMVRLGFA
jgi:ubiquinol oxidase